MRLSALLSPFLLASFAAAAAALTKDNSNLSKGTGATHTVIVAPAQGVLRFVPFAVNASVGDTVLFVWNANNHAVSKVSSLEICNKASDALSASGEHDAPFTFTQVVNDTNPMLFYAGTPSNCQKGIFGIVNPPSGYMLSTFAAQTMGFAFSNSPDKTAMAAYTNTLTSSNDKAATWGQNIDLAALPGWSHALVMENIMYTHSFLRANPGTLKDDGSVDLSSNALDMILRRAASSSTLSARAATRAAASPPSSASPKGDAPRRKSNGGAASADLE
ncbi:hypothetical protein GSI_04540 [Ganoderma sinense ZZ0214-1]|uniref:Phytocyanin domain-containing protein n=1 Tax=Ganoderma sinense ZZ0214-1 TaxID=1077348 RepID=A0A2G8SH66_9APHY|nr:hypothetical protein GSI_04540 [Ganoderma sinense ZZ0214-1]